MKFVTSDTHFFDDNMIGNHDFAPRPYNSPAEMNDAIVAHWNDVVSPNDVVYHLGDIAVYFLKPQQRAYEAIYQILESLNGHLVLIKGNHDYRGLFKYLAARNHTFDGRPKYEFHDVGALIKYDHRQYYMTHYPMMLGIAPQIINLHGHIHHYMMPAKENINVGLDAPERDFLNPRPEFGVPLSMAQVEQMIDAKAKLVAAQQKKQPRRTRHGRHHH